MSAGPLEAIMARWDETHRRADVTTRYAIEQAHQRTLTEIDRAGFEVVPSQMVDALLDHLPAYRIDGPVTMSEIRAGASRWVLEPPVRLTEDHRAARVVYGDHVALLVQEPDGKMAVHWGAPA